MSCLSNASDRRPPPPARAPPPARMPPPPPARATATPPRPAPAPPPRLARPRWDCRLAALPACTFPKAFPPRARLAPAAALFAAFGRFPGAALFAAFGRLPLDAGLFPAFDRFPPEAGRLPAFGRFAPAAGLFPVLGRSATRPPQITITTRAAWFQHLVATAAAKVQALLTAIPYFAIAEPLLHAGIAVSDTLAMLRSVLPVVVVADIVDVVDVDRAVHGNVVVAPIHSTAPKVSTRSPTRQRIARTKRNPSRD
jgi:hypothetical protein